MSESLWKAVETVILTTQQGLRYAPLAESELVGHAIEFANGATSRAFFALLGGLELPAELWKDARTAVIADQAAAEMFEPQQRRFVDDLAAIVAGEDTTEIARRASEAAARMVLVPQYELADGALEVKHRYIAEDLDARLAYITLLLLDGQRDYGRRLCRCRLESCRKFFWERRSEHGGKPGRSFCGPEHMTEWNSARAAERVRKHREKKRREKTQRRRRS